MAHKKIITLSLVGVLLVFGGLLYLRGQTGVQLYEATGLVVDGASFPVYLETHPLFRDLPSKTRIDVVIGDIHYGITGNTINRGRPENPDLTVELLEGYETVIGQKGLCEAIREAHSRGELAVTPHVSTAKLLFKYSGLLKYRTCLE
jgi:hypothetical protein